MQGESFAEHPAKPIVNGVSFQKAYYFYVIVSSIIPIILVRYTRVKYVFLNILIYFSVHISMAIIFLLFVLFFNVDILGLISINYLIEMGDFCLLAFPEGLFYGTVIAVIINAIRNKCRFKQCHIS